MQVHLSHVGKTLLPRSILHVMTCMSPKVITVEA